MHAVPVRAWVASASSAWRWRLRKSLTVRKSGLIQGSYRHEIHAFDTGLADAAEGLDPLAVTVEQQRGHHGGVIRRVALLFGIAPENDGEIELLRDQIADEVGHMSCRHEVPHRGGKSMT